ncbi:MAG: TrbI F-type domain-containing protein [Rhizorhabdus sp.]
MTDQTASPTPVDDLSAPVASAAGQTKRARTVFAGYTAMQLLLGAALLALIVWGMWVTRTLTAAPPQHIVKADLSRIVGNYVQAQARSATPPAQVEAQMKLFMASLDTELQRRGAKGQVVLVGEAVLSKSVPDITGDVMKAVYAAGVRVPQPATPAQMGAALGTQPPVPTQVAPTQLAQGALPGGFAMPQPAPAPVDPSMMAGAVDPAFNPAAGASVSSFGGPGGQ